MRQETWMQANQNVGTAERLLTAAGGGALTFYGLARGSASGLGLAALGGALVARAATGYCPVYESLGVSSTSPSESASVPSGAGVKVETAVTVERPAEELYRFWRQFDNHPRFMAHVKRVTMLPDGRSHWVADGPGGRALEWHSEVVNEVPYELIGWRTIEGADFPHAGSVRFIPAADGRSTEVKAVLRYVPPGGRFGAAIAKMIGTEPGQVLEADLRRFKQLMEAGDTADPPGTPSVVGK